MDYETGLAAVEELRPLVPDGRHAGPARAALDPRSPTVSTVIPGAQDADQARANVAAADLPELSSEALGTIAEVYAERIAPLVHQRW